MPPKNVDTQQKRGFVYRYIFIAVFFVLVCVFYAIAIGKINSEAPSILKKSDNEEKYTTRTVSVCAVRGEIFDRNGKALVSNEYSYSVTFDYSAMSYSRVEQNGAILEVIKTLRDCGKELGADMLESAFSGVYPYMGYDDGVLEGGTAAARHERILSNNGLEVGASADALADALAKKYSMTDKDGAPLYTDAEMTDLLNVRYAMEAIRFSAVEPFVFAEDADLSAVTAISEKNIRGAAIKLSYTRVYNYPGYASHILGRIGKIQAENADYYTSQGYEITATVGLDGCEYAFEQYLRGIDGEMLITEDAYGNVVNREIVREPVAGKDVYLTIDIDLQVKAEDSLAKNIEDIKAAAVNKKGELNGEDADAGALVVQSADGGEILAIASYPTYDLSTFGRDYSDLVSDEKNPLFNRALQGTYAPGSTFKVGIALAGLLERPTTFSGDIFGASTIISTNGYYNKNSMSGVSVEDAPKCWIYPYYAHKHGNIDVKTALRVSCNCFFYELGDMLGIDNINKYCKLYGLGEKTGVELPESSGILASPEYKLSFSDPNDRVWTAGNTVATAIGQGYNAFTPLQISNYVATIVNGGKRYSAHLLGEVKTFGGQTVVKYSPNVVSSFDMAEHYSTIISAMSSVIEEGSASTAFDGFPIKIGGKTGTAQVNKTQSDNAVFVGFAPLDDPEIVVSCVIEKGAKGLNAAQSVRAVMAKYFGIEE